MLWLETGRLAVHGAQGLIGREMFAIDGVRMPSNASKQRSGTRAAFEQQAAKLEADAQTMLARHRATDALPLEPDLDTKAIARVAPLQHDAAELRTWLAAHPEGRRGPTGGVRQSNRTDDNSAKMATSPGVIQGYTGVAAFNAQTPMIVVAQAHRTGAEQEVLTPVVDALQSVMAPTSFLTADAGQHSAANLRLPRPFADVAARVAACRPGFVRLHAQLDQQLAWPTSRCHECLAMSLASKFIPGRLLPQEKGAPPDAPDKSRILFQPSARRLRRALR